MQKRAATACIGLLVGTIAMACSGCMEAVRADAGLDRTVDPGETVTLDGGSSLPNRRYALAYSWAVIDGPQVTLSDPQARVTTFVAPRLPAESTLIIELTATYVDLGGNMVESNSDTDRIIIRVHADPDAPAEESEQGDVEVDGADQPADVSQSQSS